MEKELKEKVAEKLYGCIVPLVTEFTGGRWNYDTELVELINKFLPAYSHADIRSVGAKFAEINHFGIAPLYIDFEQFKMLNNKILNKRHLLNVVNEVKQEEEQRIKEKNRVKDYIFYFSGGETREIKAVRHVFDNQIIRFFDENNKELNTFVGVTSFDSFDIK